MDIESENSLDVKRQGPHNLVVLFTSCIILLGAVFDLFGVSLIGAAASCDLDLGLHEISLLNSLPFAGQLFALPWGYYADTRGRRKAILLSTTISLIFATLSSFSTSFEMMVTFKLFGCVFSSASITLTFTYLGECTTHIRRNKYLFILNSCNMASSFILYALAYMLLRLEFSIAMPWLSITYRPWRLFALVLALPLGVGALMMAFLQESPSFLASKGEAAKPLKALRTTNEVRGSNDEQVVSSLVMEDISGKKNSLMNSFVKQMFPIFRPPLLWSTIQIFILTAISVSANNIIFMWYPTLLQAYSSDSELSSERSGFCEYITLNVAEANQTIQCNDTIPESTIFSGMAFSVFFTVINLAASRVASWRKTVLITIMVISGSSAFLLNWTRLPILNVILFTLIQTTSVNLGNLLSYFHDIYPTSYRGIASILGLMFAKLTSLCGVSVSGILMVDHCNITFYGFSLYILSGAALAWSFLPADR